MNFISLSDRRLVSHLNVFMVLVMKMLYMQFLFIVNIFQLRVCLKMQFILELRLF